MGDDSRRGRARALAWGKVGLVALAVAALVWLKHEPDLSRTCADAVHNWTAACARGDEGPVEGFDVPSIARHAGLEAAQVESALRTLCARARDRRGVSAELRFAIKGLQCPSGRVVICAVEEQMQDAELGFACEQGRVTRVSLFEPVGAADAPEPYRCERCTWP